MTEKHDIKPLATKKPRRMGRPALQPPKDAIDIITEGASRGASMRVIASALAISVETLRKWLDENPDLEEAFVRGREKERSALHGSLYDAAMAGNIVAAMFLLKSRHGYREGDQGEQANRVSINFNLPGALPTEKFIEVSNEPARITAK